MAKKDSAGGKVKARVLVDCALGKANDVVELTVDEAAAHGADVDTHESAVAYAEDLAAEKAKSDKPAKK